MTNVLAGMATLTSRAGVRGLAIDSIQGQVDRLVVANGDERGDQAKFLAAADAPGDTIFLGVDDDLIYPADYVDTILAGLDRHPGCIVSFHGWTIDEDGECYAENYRCLETVHEDVQVHVAGTGVCAFHLDTIRPVMADFESVNADVWLAVRAQERRIPRIVIAHPSYWIGYTQLPGAIPDADGAQQLAESVYAHTRHRTGTRLDGSEGFARATGRLSDLIYG
jgi:hypothetical protein